MGSRLPTFGAGPPSQPASSSSGSQGQTRVPPSPPTPGHCSEDDLMGWFPGRSMLPAPLLKPASGCPLHDAPWTKPLRAGRVDLGRGSWHLMANRAPHKEMYNQGLHCLCGAFRKPFLACLRKRNFCGKCLSFMLLADLQAFLRHGGRSDDCSPYKRRQTLRQDTEYGVCQLADTLDRAQTKSKGEDVCPFQHSLIPP